MIECPIDGNKFSDLNGFYQEIITRLAPERPWLNNMDNRTVDTFEELLKESQFGDAPDEFSLVWKNSEKSRRDFTDPFAKIGKNQETIWESILNIIKENSNVKLVLQ